MSDREEIKYGGRSSGKSHSIIIAQQQTIDKLTKEVEDCEIAITAVSDLVDSNKEDYFNSTKIHVEENTKLLNANILLANERLKLKEEIEGLSKLASNRLIELSKNSNAWSKENTKLKEGLNDIKSQLFDVNNCDTILTSAIEQILKNK